MSVAILAASLLALAACAAPSSDVAVGRAYYQDNCSTCHGAKGAGDGPMSVFVATGVPNLRELSYRNDGSFPRAYVIDAITKISERHDDIVAMPDFGTLLNTAPTTYTTSDGTVLQTDSAVLAIVDYLESIQEG